MGRKRWPTELRGCEVECCPQNTWYRAGPLGMPTKPRCKLSRVWLTAQGICAVLESRVDKEALLEKAGVPSPL